MDRVFESGAAASPPSAPGSPSTGYATGGNPGGGTPATKPGPWWYHMITEELRAVIVAAGLTPDHANIGQLAAAISALSLAVASTAEAQAQTNNTKALTPLRLADAFKGANQSLSGSGYQLLPGGLILQWMEVTISTAGYANYSYPLAWPTGMVAAAALVNQSGVSAVQPNIDRAGSSLSLARLSTINPQTNTYISGNKVLFVFVGN